MIYFAVRGAADSWRDMFFRNERSARRAVGQGEGPIADPVELRRVEVVFGAGAGARSFHGIVGFEPDGPEAFFADEGFARRSLLLITEALPHLAHRLHLVRFDAEIRPLDPRSTPPR
jgi:hypothetical protein